MLILSNENNNSSAINPKTFERETLFYFHASLIVCRCASFIDTPASSNKYVVDDGDGGETGKSGEKEHWVTRKLYSQRERNFHKDFIEAGFQHKHIMCDYKIDMEFLFDLLYLFLYIASLLHS